MQIKLEATSTKTFYSNAYFEDGVYTTVLYLDTEFGRPTFNIFREIKENALGGQRVVRQSEVQELNFAIFATNPLLDVLATVGFLDTVTLTYLNTQEVITLKNVRFEDNGERTDLANRCTLFCELEPVYSTACEDSKYSKS